VERILRGRPNLTTAEAGALAATCFGVEGTVSALISERDQNFRIAGPDADFVLKVANSNEARATLECQNAILEKLQGNTFDVPGVCRALDGTTIPRGGSDNEYLVRLLTWVGGTPLAAIQPPTIGLYRELGELAARVGVALEGFDHPAAERNLKWDLRQGPEIVRERLHLIPAADDRALVEATLDRYARVVAPQLAELRTGLIQNDLNDHNVLVSDLAMEDGWPTRHVSGVIDMGDALPGWVVADLAIAIAYALLGRDDVLGVSRAITAGYHAVRPLDAAEINVVLGLVSMRLALSVANAAEQTAEEPDNEYLRVSEAPAWQALEHLAALDSRLAICHLRAACGLEPCAAGGVLRRWLTRPDLEVAPVVGSALAGPTVHVFDLGVGSTEMGVGAPGDFETRDLSEKLFGQMAAAGKAVGLGRYDEVRSWYGGDLFEAPADEAPRRRTVHVGIDVFLEAGAAVAAPLDGTVVSAAINPGRLDYGPTLIIEHAPHDGPTFWSLYGHLAPESVTAIEIGQVVRAGEPIGAIGDYPGNGDWPPHLHFQLIADRLDYTSDFPGVCAPDERAVWTSLSPDPARLLGLDARQVAPVGLPTEMIAQHRARAVGPSLSIAYRRPLHIARGYRQFLYNAEGQPFLDTVNNVPHVGHCHPHVVAAAAAQNAVLNTNTRYLHGNLVRYAERLAATLPDPLAVCYFVCSGSEANELAIRIARTATGRRDIVALDGAYHGNSSTLIDISPYKHDGPGGRGAPDWVHIAAMPDPYRGKFAGRDDCGARFAADVRRCCREAESHGGAAALIAEPLLGCGGQIVPPAGYLPAAFAHTRAAGGLCIADEVQVGFGRAGTHFWAFETQGVVPDIVTLGKPIGNGFPLAAVVTTPELAAAFANGMEYFNTFGGNPVSCAVGNAVLDVLETEELQTNALRVGGVLLDGLAELADRHPIIGDVRGLGLYLGAELVDDRDTKAPAAAAASYVVNRMRDHGILISTDGPDHNVLKLKPPMCFEATDARRFLRTLDKILEEDYIRAAGNG
jgi:4-aminobutyrate aminotransferase-like enzyme/Ser/Thr protein kinase RdoA (MazF antagonist)